MSKEFKAVVIIFVAFFGLLALAAVAIIVFFATTISHAVGSNDAASKAHTAAKIASVKLPPGYEYLMAMDLGVMNMVGIHSTDKSRKGFTILMEGVSVPSGSESDEDLMASMQKGLSTSTHCDADSSAKDDPIATSSGITIAFRELQCKASNGDPMTVEIGHIPSTYPLAIVMAMGKPNEFDKQALHELVGSMP